MYIDKHCNHISSQKLRGSLLEKKIQDFPYKFKFIPNKERAFIEIGRHKNLKCYLIPNSSHNKTQYLILCYRFAVFFDRISVLIEIIVGLNERDFFT